MDHVWRIDNALRLHPAVMPATARAIRMREQAIDTIMLRNIDTVCRAVFGEGGVLLFSSSMCWGSFDVGCVLRDGRVICFENKGAKATPSDIRKFIRDVQQVNDGGLLYLASRWQHMKDYWDDYVVLSRRMFASFLLNVRCDVEQDSRDLLGEAAGLLGISRKEFIRRHDSAIDWLMRIRGPVSAKGKGHVGLYEYLKAEKIQIRGGPTSPVLVTRSADLAWTRKCVEALCPSVNVNATLVDWTFYSDSQPYPTWAQLRVCGQLG